MFRKYAKTLAIIPSVDLLRRIVENTMDRSHIAGFFVGCELSMQVGVVVVPTSSDFLEVVAAPSIPDTVLAHRLSTLTAGLEKLDLGDILVRGFALAALANSQASRTLRSLKISRSRLTETTDSCWIHFSALRELELGGWIEQKVMVGICAHRTLKKLVLTGDGDDLISAILAPDSLPSLRHLSCEFYVSSLRLRTLLLCRPNAHKFRVLPIRLDVSHSDRSRGGLDLHLVCPRLREILPISLMRPVLVKLKEEYVHSEDGSVAVPLKNLRHIVSLTPNRIKVSFQTVMELAAAFPKLEHLKLRHDRGGVPVPKNPLRFDLFRGLKTLFFALSTYSSPERPQFECFPPHLQSLSIYITPQPTPSSEIDQLLDTLSQSSPMVSRICLEYGGLSLSRRHLELCLLSFSNLRTLDLANTDPDPDAVEAFKISHLNLQRVPRVCVCGVRVVTPVWLPNCRQLLVSLPRDSALFPETFAFPNLSQAVVTVAEESDPNAVLQAIANKWPSLRSLRFSTQFTWKAQKPVVDYGPFSSMTSLRKLCIDRDVGIPQMGLARMLRVLSLLVDLEATVELSSNDFGWLAHEKIVALRLDLRVELSVWNSRGGELDLTPQTFPELRSLHLKIPCLTATTIANLPDLEDVSVEREATATRKADLHVRSCPRLSEAQFSHCAFNALEFVDLPRLKCVRFIKCVPAEAPMLLHGCHRLAKFIVLAEDREMRKWVRSSVPAPCLFDLQVGA